MWTVGQASEGVEWAGGRSDDSARQKHLEDGHRFAGINRQSDWRLGWRDARGKKGNLEGAGAQWRGI